MKYRQVGMKGTGIYNGYYTIAWIPEKFAVLDKEIKIDVKGDVVWRIDWVSKNTIGDAIYPEALIREHRRNTGDSLQRKKRND